MSFERLSPSDHVILTEMKDGSGVLLHLATKFYYTLNPTGVFVWKELEADHPVGLEDLAERVHRNFRVDRGQAVADLTPLISDLVAEDLLEAQ